MTKLLNINGEIYAKTNTNCVNINLTWCMAFLHINDYIKVTIPIFFTHGVLKPGEGMGKILDSENG